ncbi:MAG: dicarboxylate/amino acid:cation symporter, partial [Pirellulaceae bacterium]|nr:dicarboxylate/amino acid:cation symporter [Pirellulaceae bacterium]
PSSGMFPANLFAAASATNVLALITFSIVFGGALTTLGAKGKPAIDFFNSINEAIMQIVKLVMFFAPVGIFGLVASNIANTGGAEAFYEEMERIGRYAMTVMLGLGIHFFVLASLIALLARQNPITYTLGVLRAMLTAVSTASSSATLPITMECVEENNNVSPRTSSFVLPLGATVNMDGTALYEAVAVIFIAQSLGIDLTGAELLIVFLTVTLAAVGAAGIPGAGLVTMVIVLQAVDLPTEKIGMILAIDWFLDRLRTTINVYGDAVGAGVVDRLTRNERANGVT